MGSYLNEEAGYKKGVNWPIFRDSLALGNGDYNYILSLFISLRLTCTFLYHISVLQIHNILLFVNKNKVLNKIVKLYNREMDTAAKRVSSGTTFIYSEKGKTQFICR